MLPNYALPTKVGNIFFTLSPFRLPLFRIFNLMPRPLQEELPRFPFFSGPAADQLFLPLSFIYEPAGGQPEYICFCGKAKIW